MRVRGMSLVNNFSFYAGSSILLNRYLCKLDTQSEKHTSEAFIVICKYKYLY